MPIVRDFKRYPYRAVRLDRCGRDIGSKVYWKLYAIENTVRIVIHSVLTAQFGPGWWTVAVDPKIRSRTTGFRLNYTRKPKNASPGTSDIHLAFLTDLTEILRANAHLFTPVIPDTDRWIARLEAIRLPRNLVGHMNFPNSYDRSEVDSAYSQLTDLVDCLIARRVPILTPS